MSQHDPPTSDLGARDDARVLRLRHYATHGSYHSTEVALRHDVTMLLAAYDAQADRLAAVERDLALCMKGAWTQAGINSAWDEVTQQMFRPRTLQRIHRAMVRRDGAIRANLDRWMDLTQPSEGDAGAVGAGEPT